jgi:hypothetical protein
MAIKTSTFGAVTLTGHAAKSFKKQFLGSNVKANPEAQKSLAQGRHMLKELNKKGYVTIKSSKNN